MRNKPYISIFHIASLLYIFFLLTGSVHAVGERNISLGSTSGWEFVENRQGIIEASMIRPNPVLVLSSQMDLFAGNEDYLDCYLSFDQGSTRLFSDSRGNYDVIVSQTLATTGNPWSKAGPGAALFTGDEYDEALVLRPLRGALLASGNHVRDFAIEFWLYPYNLETGEQLLHWSASRLNNRGNFEQQSIQASIYRNHLNWTFENFFLSPGEGNSRTISFSGPALLNRTWSHHHIRFDSDLGLIEYMVDGRLEAVEYTTSSGREGGEVFMPLIGNDGRLVLGGRFTGMIDEFRIHRENSDSSRLTRFPSQGGRIETQALDLGRTNSQVRRIEAFGGRTGISRTANFNRNVRNEYTGNSTLRFSDHSEIKLFVRTSNHRYIWDDIPWIPINNGAALPPALQGRFVQIAADFYPSGDCETSPYLSEIKVYFHAADPPSPPSNLIAVAKDGAVELSWRPSHSRNLGGYLVYYGTAQGEYFWDNGLQKSPINVGNQTSIRIEGLRNGTLYYFTVAGYEVPLVEPEHLAPEFGRMLPEPGEFSREVAARPLRMPDLTAALTE